MALRLQNARDGTLDEGARAALDAASWQVRDAANRLRGVIFELMAPMRSADLRTAAEAYCSVLFAGSAIAWEISGVAPEDLEPEVGVMAYRVIQEAARNAARHSRGDRARVALEHTSDELIVSVSDDGVGLGRDGGAPFPAHAGLEIIAQRAWAIGGTVAFDVGLDGRGTSVVVSIPLGGDGLA